MTNNNYNNVRSTGFTLVELLIVLVISVSLIGISSAAYSKLSTGSYLKGVTRHVAATLRYARNYAITQGVEADVKIDVQNRAYSYPGANEPIYFKKSIHVEALSSGFLTQSKDVAIIRFSPDGSSTGGVVALSSRNKTYQIQVDWLTGQVHIND